MVFPVNVPNVPGVPSVIFAVGSQTPLTLLTQDLVPLLTGLAFSQAWGIYSGGLPVVIADNVEAFDYRQMWAFGGLPD